MTPKLPSLKPKQVLKILKRAGFEIDHQTGSHITLLNNKTNTRVTLSMHSKDTKKGTLHGIIKNSGLTPEEFLDLR